MMKKFKKIEVNGEFEDKLYTYLKEKINKDTVIGVKNKLIMEGIKKISKTCKKKNDIVWNFTKFLVDKEGNVIYRLSPIESPYVLEEKIKQLLKD